MPGKDPRIIIMMPGIIGGFFDLGTWLLTSSARSGDLAVYHLATSRGHHAHG